MYRSDTIEIGGGAEWSVHLISVIKKTVIDLVLAGFFAEGNDGLESMTPQNFRW